MSNQDIIQGVLNFAIGMERILKGILYNINPTYILVAPEFRNSLPILYDTRIINREKNNNVLNIKLNRDVITFRNSLLRSSSVSKSAQNNKNKLFSLSNLRDVIAHHEIEIMDINQARNILQRDFYFIILDFVDEFGLNKFNCFGEYENNINALAKKHQQDIKNIIRLKIEEHRLKWEKLDKASEIISRKHSITNELLESDYRHETSCPACNQPAILYTEADYVIDTDTAEKTIIGQFVRKIRCEFCGLIIDDAGELDELGFGSLIYPDNSYYDYFDDDIPF